jgi:hypothetical protein
MHTYIHTYIYLSSSSSSSSSMSSDVLPAEVLQQLSHLRHRAAGCIDNFFQALPAEQAMLPSPAQLWSGLCTQVDLDLANSRSIGDASVSKLHSFICVCIHVATNPLKPTSRYISFTRITLRFENISTRAQKLPPERKFGQVQNYSSELQSLDWFSRLVE